MILKKLISFNEYQKASLFYILVAFIFLFPAFLGKVDTPFDIRDLQMYPWRYYNVSEKVIKNKLWEGSFLQDNKTIDKETGLPVVSIKVSPNKAITLESKLNLNEELSKEVGSINNSNYWISFDTKQISDEPLDLTISFALVNRNTGETFYPQSPLLYLDTNKKIGWTRTKLYLNPLVNKLKSVSDLSQYNLQIVFTNTDKDKQALLYLRDFKLQCNDYSKIPTVHNYYNADLIQEFIPYREYFSDSLKRGRINFWNPYILTGAEFTSEPQLGYFHPVYFLSYLFFDHFTAHLIITFLFFILCGIGAFILARYWGLGFSASLFTGLVYMFHPFNAKRFSYEYMLMISGTLPFLLLYYEKTLNEIKFLNKNLLCSSLLLGLIFLSGHLQFVEYAAIFFLMFACFRLVLDIFSNKSRISKNIMSICFIFFFGTLIGSSVLVPFFQLLQNSNRAPISDLVIKFQSLSFNELLGVIYPYYKGKPIWSHVGLPSKDPEYNYYRFMFYKHYIYFGFLPFLLSICTLKSFFKNKLVVFFYTTIILSMLIVMGSPLIILAKNLIPGFDKMQHIKFLTVYSYSIPFLSGIGFQILINFISRFKKNIKYFLITTIIFITAADLMYFCSFFVTWSDREDYKPVPKGGSLKFILDEQKKSKEPFRIISFISQSPYERLRNIQMPKPNTLMPYKIERIGGYTSFVQNDIFNLLSYLKTRDSHQLYTKEIYKIFENANEIYPTNSTDDKILDLLNVRFLLTPRYLNLESKNIKKVYQGDCSVYKNLAYYPRAFVVNNYKMITSPKDTIVELDKKDFNPRQEVILMSSPIDYKDLPSNDSTMLSYKVKFVKYEPDQVILKVNINKNGFLVLGNNLNSNWRVKVNSLKSHHYQANLVQRAVYLPKAGDYLIEFYYFPKLFIIGFAITCFAIFILLSLFIFLRLKKRNISSKTICTNQRNIQKKLVKQSSAIL